LVQVVAAGVADSNVNALHSRPGLLPVAAVSPLPAHRLLRLAQRRLVTLEAAERGVDRAVAQGRESDNAEVDTDRFASGNGSRHFPFGLDRHKPLAGALADGDVSRLSQHLAAAAVAHPAEFRQEEAARGLIELDLLRIRIPKALVTALLLEARKVGTSGEEIPVRALQILQRLLQRVDRRVLQPGRLLAVAPLGQHPA